METEIKAQREEAISLYSSGSKEQKELLEKLFGKQTFSREDNLENITTWEAICKIKKIDPVSDLPYPTPKTQKQEKMNYYFMLTEIAELYNAGWAPDYGNNSEYKYFPYFEYKKSSAGFGFSYSSWFFSYSCTNVCSRLVFKTEELAECVGRNFSWLYSKYLMFKP